MPRDVNNSKERENMYSENEKFTNQSGCKWDVSKWFIYKTQECSVDRALAIEMQEPAFELPELT